MRTQFSLFISKPQIQAVVMSLCHKFGTLCFLSHAQFIVYYMCPERKLSHDLTNEWHLIDNFDLSASSPEQNKTFCSMRQGILLLGIPIKFGQI